MRTILRQLAARVRALPRRRAPEPGAPSALATAYEAHRRRASARSARQVEAGQEIGPIPAVVDPERKERCRLDLRAFCETYLRHIFHRPWSKDQKRTLADLQRRILEGGLQVFAMPRGEGKTAMIRAAALWAVLYGHCKFCVILCAMAEKAKLEHIYIIQTVLETVPALSEDFPEAVYPIRCLERITHRQRGQRLGGEPTYIQWLGNLIVLPRVPGSAASGGVITAMGLESGRLHGSNQYDVTTGQILRPDLVLVDDPQTDESARSPTQTDTRERLVTSDALGMAGVGKALTAFAAVTIRHSGDLADRLLSRETHPEWHGRTMKLVYRLPANAKLWDEYGAILRECRLADASLDRVHAFYRGARATCGLPLDEDRPCADCPRRSECMDAGALVANPTRLDEGDGSALEYAMRLALERPEYFARECQNEPPVDKAAASLQTPEALAARLSEVPRGQVPLGATQVVAAVDVHKEVLYWIVCAFAPDFTGWVVDYGTWPDQERTWFEQANCPRTLGRIYQRAGMEGAILAGLRHLTDGRPAPDRDRDPASPALCVREWKREDGAALRVSRCLVDANWGQTTELVHEFCRRSPHAAVVMPSHGKGISATGRPLSEYTQRGGDQPGYHWRLPSLAGKKRMTRYVLIDTNFWKSFVQARLSVAPGDRGGLLLWGREAKAHRLLAAHLVSEVPQLDQSQGRSVDVWKPGGGRFDNHWLDGLVACHVAASMGGAALAGATAAEPDEKPVSFAALQRRARRRQR